MEKHQNYTLPLGLLLAAAGVFLRYHIGRRRFGRRGIGGLQQFPSYGRYILVTTVERIIYFFATVSLWAGLFLIVLAGYEHFKF